MIDEIMFQTYNKVISKLTPADISARETMLYSTLELYEESRRKYDLINRLIDQDIDKLLYYRQIAVQIPIIDSQVQINNEIIEANNEIIQTNDKTNVFILDYNTLTERKIIKQKISDLAVKGIITNTDYLVIDKIVNDGRDKYNLWRDHGYDIIQDLKLHKLRKEGIHTIYGFPYQKLLFEFNHCRNMEDYLGAGALLLDFEEEILLGKTKTPNSFSEGVFNYYNVKLNEAKEANSKRLPSLFLVINDIHLRTGVISEFCLSNKLEFTKLNE